MDVKLKTKKIIARFFTSRIRTPESRSRRKEKIQGRNFKICLTYFELCQTYFLPYENCFETCLKKADISRRETLL